MVRSRSSRFASRFAISMASVAVLAMAGCTSVSLKEPPQVVDWSRSGSAPVSSVQAPADNSTYVVKRGDTLASVAARFNTTPTNIASWNNLGPNPQVRPEQVLRVVPPGAPTSADAAPVATTQAIVNDGIESRPLGGTTVAPVAPPVQGDVPLKTGPLGLKQPYSDAVAANVPPPPGPATLPPQPDNSIATPVSPSGSPSNAAPLTFAWPVAGKPARGFDERSKGVDIPGRMGEPILAVADGRVTYSGIGVRGYGNFVIVQHAGNLLSVYANNSKNLVKEGAAVTKGQAIAEMGNSESANVKLHFEIRRDGNPVDPSQYLPAR